MFTASDASSQKAAISAGCTIWPENAYHVTEDNAALHTAVRHKVLSGQTKQLAYQMLACVQLHTNCLCTSLMHS